jgi:DNA adenine methylase
MDSLKGKAIVSINDHPDIRRIFGRFEVESLEIDYTVGGGKGIASSELIVYSCERIKDPAGLF